MFGFERHKVLLVSGLVISTFGLASCSSWFEETSTYDVTEEVALDQELPPAPVLIPREAPIPEQAFDAPAGGGAWVERAPYNALPEMYGNSAEDIAASVPVNDDELMRMAREGDCEDDYRILGAKDGGLNNALEIRADTGAGAGTANITAGIKDGASATLMRGADAGEVTDASDVEDWLAPEGASLRSLLMDWGDRAGWKVIWKSDREYLLEAGAVFRGRYMDVTSALVRTFARARPAPIATFYKGNKVLLVTTLEDENAD